MIKKESIIISHELGDIDSLQFYRKISDLLSLRLNYPEFKKIWSDIFTENISIIKFLERIKDSQKVIISNIDPLHWEVARSFNVVKNYFPENMCVKSFEVNFRKPSKEIYEIAQKLLPKNSKIFYLDDIQEYIDQGGRMGFTSIRYDCRFDDVSKLIDLL